MSVICKWTVVSMHVGSNKRGVASIKTELLAQNWITLLLCLIASHFIKLLPGLNALIGAHNSTGHDQVTR